MCLHGRSDEGADQYGLGTRQEGLPAAGAAALAFEFMCACVLRDHETSERPAFGKINISVWDLKWVFRKEQRCSKPLGAASARPVPADRHRQPRRAAAAAVVPKVTLVRLLQRTVVVFTFHVYFKPFTKAWHCKGKHSV